LHIENKPKFGKYQLLEQLGAGATAEVYRALDRTLEREVALKLLKPSLVGDTQAFERFLQEARGAARLFHPNIATVLEVGESEGRYYLAMRYIPGQSLDKLLAEQRCLSWEEALRMAEQIGGALDFAHGQGFLHRDVKPSNIIRTPEGDFVLTDFGLVKAMMATGLTTHTGALLGTPPYMAPEIWLGQPTTPATDQYALACVVYEALTRKVLFDGETPPAVMTQHVLKGAEMGEEWPLDAPQEVKAVLSKALAKEPAERYATAGEFVEALQGLEKAAVVEEGKESRSEAEVLLETGKRLEEQGELQAALTVYRQAQRLAAVHPGLLTEINARVQELEKTIGQTYSMRPTTSANEMVISLAPGIEMAFVRVPAGEFIMGSPKKVSYRDEHPRHEVYLDEYWMGKTPVTNIQYQTFVKATGHRAPWHWEGNLIPTGKGEHPVVCVTWQDAQEFCAWVSQISGQAIRLPTEAEWEKAARGSDERLYPWGNQEPNPQLCNYNTNGSTPVGKYSPQGDSPYGCVDMAGNVWEWVADWYDKHYYAYSPSRNPSGPESGKYRVLRGGSWNLNENSVRASNRSWGVPVYWSDSIGFRCSRSP